MISTDSTLTNTGLKPFDHDAEQGLLASIGKNSECLVEAAERGMNPEWFSLPIAIEVCETMLKNDAESWEVDDITISLAIDKDRRQDAFALFDMVETSAHFTMYLDKVEGLYLKRRAMDACNQVLELAHEPTSTSQEVLELAGSKFSQLSLKDRSKSNKASEIIEATWANIVARQGAGGIDGIPSLIPSLDKLTYGWHEGDLILVAARTSVGKTAFSCELALSALKSGKSVLYFSLEMQSESVMERMLANVSGVPIRVMVDKVCTSGQQ